MTTTEYFKDLDCIYNENKLIKMPFDKRKFFLDEGFSLRETHEVLGWELHPVIIKPKKKTTGARRILN